MDHVINELIKLLHLSNISSVKITLREQEYLKIRYEIKVCHTYAVNEVLKCVKFQ